MRNILIIGAGRSASSLIQYLLNKSNQEQLQLTIADIALELAQRKTNNHPNATAIAIDISNENQRKSAIEKADIVISMLPGLNINANQIPIPKANVVTISKKTNDFKPILPTIFKSPIELIPRTIVKKMMGGTKHLIIAMKTSLIIFIFTPMSGLK